MPDRHVLLLLDIHRHRDPAWITKKLVTDKAWQKLSEVGEQPLLVLSPSLLLNVRRSLLSVSQLILEGGSRKGRVDKDKGTKGSWPQSDMTYSKHWKFPLQCANFDIMETKYNEYAISPMKQLGNMGNDKKKGIVVHMVLSMSGNSLIKT